MALDDYMVDPYRIQPYSAATEEEEDVSEVPISAVSDPWTEAQGSEAGVDPQAGATTALGDQFVTDEYGVPGQVNPNAKYNRGPGMPQYRGAGKTGPWQTGALKQLAITGGSAAMTAGIGAIAARSGSSASMYTAGQGGAYGGMAVQTQSGAGGAGSAGSSGASQLGFGMQMVGSAYAGYEASPYGAMFEQEYMGGYSPGYVGSGSATPLFQAYGGRTDKEAKQQRGQRIGMMGAGAIAGAMGGGGYGAIAGAAGAYFQENPNTGKRGYQETWKYDIKPAGKSFGKMFKDGPYTKDGTIRNLTNMKQWGRSFKSMIPGMGGMGGGGKKPPPESQIKRDIQYHLAGQVNLDYQVQEWWNRVADKGSGAGREYIKGGLQTEGRSWGTDEMLPEWATNKNTFGKGHHAYQYGPEEVGGQRVASQRNVNTLAGLQAKMEDMGSRREFWKSYMEDYSMFKEGGQGYQGKWHGKNIYDIPSEIYGQTPQEMWGDIDFDADYQQDLDWLRMNEEEEAV